MTTKKKSKENQNKKSKVIVFILLGVGLIIGIVSYYHSLRYKSTDDAQIDTDIISVTSRVSGYIARVNFEDNSYVHAGDTLVILDDRELALRENQAEAAFENALAMLETTRENTHSVEQGGGTTSIKIVELQIRLQNTTKDYQRYKKMLAKGSVTQQQFDRISTEKETLEKQIEAARLSEKEVNSKIGAANQQVSVSQTIVKQRRIELEYAKLNHSYAYVIAPFDGVVSKKNAAEGQLIQMGQALCSIISTKNIWVTANFKETQIKDMEVGMPVEINVDAYPDDVITGKLSSFSSATGSKFSLIPPDNASGNYVKVVQRIPAHIELDKNSEIYKSIKPGMNVTVKVILY